MNKEYGFIVKFWHIIVVVLGFVFATGGAYYKVLETETKVEKTERRIEDLEHWKEQRVEALHKVELDVSDIRIKTNLMYEILVKKELEKPQRR